eukprot:252064-Chlamydomonas_euryale.AAC.1
MHQHAHAARAIATTIGEAAGLTCQWPVRAPVRQLALPGTTKRRGPARNRGSKVPPQAAPSRTGT